MWSRARPNSVGCSASCPATSGGCRNPSTTSPSPSPTSSASPSAGPAARQGAGDRRPVHPHLPSARAASRPRGGLDHRLGHRRAPEEGALHRGDQKPGADRGRPFQVCSRRGHLDADDEPRSASSAAGKSRDAQSRRPSLRLHQPADGQAPTPPARSTTSIARADDVMSGDLPHINNHRADDEREGGPAPRRARPTQITRVGAARLHMTMKTEIHPNYQEAHVRCTAVNGSRTRPAQPISTLRSARRAIPSTPADKLVDTGGMVERSAPRRQRARTCSDPR